MAARVEMATAILSEREFALSHAPDSPAPRSSKQASVEPGAGSPAVFRRSLTRDIVGRSPAVLVVARTSAESAFAVSAASFDRAADDGATFAAWVFGLIEIAPGTVVVQFVVRLGETALAAHELTRLKVMLGIGGISDTAASGLGWRSGKFGDVDG